MHMYQMTAAQGGVKPIQVFVRCKFDHTSVIADNFKDITTQLCYLPYVEFEGVSHTPDLACTSIRGIAGRGQFDHLDHMDIAAELVAPHPSVTAISCFELKWQYHDYDARNDVFKITSQSGCMSIEQVSTKVSKSEVAAMCDDDDNFLDKYIRASRVHSQLGKPKVQLAAMEDIDYNTIIKDMKLVSEYLEQTFEISEGVSALIDVDEECERCMEEGVLQEEHELQEEALHEEEGEDEKHVDEQALADSLDERIEDWVKRNWPESDVFWQSSMVAASLVVLRHGTVIGRVYEVGALGWPDCCRVGATGQTSSNQYQQAG